MREIAKSVLGFSWAVSLFGLQQMSKLLTPSAGPDVAASQFDAVTREVQSHLSDSVADQFRTGDEWQRRVVDAVFDAGSLRSLDPQVVATTLDPRRVVQAIDPRAVVQSSVTMVQRSVDAIRQSVQAAPSTPNPAL